MKRANRIKLALHRGASRAFVLGPLVFLLVAGAGCPSLFESTTHRATKIKQAVVGRDGARTVNAADTVVNAYVALTANAAVAATTLTVANVTDLTTNFSRALAQGDLLLIMQMQGATINTTDDTVDYGSIASEADLGSAGRYEFAGVEAVATATNQITLACPLRHAYTLAGRTQVIRVPQYTTLTINTGGSITAPAWNGATGGIVAVHAETTVQLDGSIDASARGFRGGAVDNGSAAAGTAVTIYRSGTNTQGAEKGESIAGYQADYTNGRYGRGAPANGGGGGNSHNGGGGGGANAGAPAGWSLGQGVMLDTVVGAAAWALDPGYLTNPVAANSRTNSEGGGRGGYSYSNVDGASANPVFSALTVGPNDARWGGNNRREVGGLGGRPLASSPTTRLFLGGGGGAGDRNNGSTGSAGGNGGGLVFLIAGTVTGAGSILANGDDAAPSPGVATAGDAPGGGGGGGTVVVNAGSLSAITISVNGGAGGNQTGSGSQAEAEGPGGGGGGGYVAIAGTGTPTLSAAGAVGGTSNRTAMVDFPSDGATAGHAGITSGSASNFFYCGAPPVTTIETNPTNPSASNTGDFTFSNTSSPVTYECKLDSGAWAACTASYTTPTLTDGSHTLSVRATDSYGNVEPTPPSYTWVVDTTAPDTSITTKPSNPTADPTGDFVFGSTEPGVTYECKLDAATDWAACPASYTTPALADGSHTLSVRATDAAGNVDGTPVSYTWEVNTLLLTTIATHPLNPTADTTGDFTFTNTQSPVTYECKLDSGAWAACGASYTTPVLADGSHTLSVRATLSAADAGATVEDPPVTFTWTVNANGLLTTIATHPTNPTADTTGDFTFTNGMSPVTYECKLDTGAWAACGASYTTPVLADGSHTLSVRATLSAADGGTMVEDPPVTFTWTVNTRTPVTTIATHPTNPSSDPTGDFTFTNTLGPVTYECKLDSGAWAACGASYTTPVLGDGSHTLSVRATLSGVDGGSIVEDPPVTFTWTIRTDRPTTIIATHPTNPSNDTTGDFTFTNTQSPVTYECKLDSGDWAACAASYTTPVLADGSHTLSVRATATATDAGTVVEDPPVIYTWVIDTVPPDTSIVTKPSDPSSDATGDFTFASTESPVTYACKLDATDWAPCTASYTTPALTNGSHTLSVRATDAAGNVDGTPATYTWTIQGVPVVDGGVVVDAQASEANPRIDSAALDSARDLPPEVQQAVPEPGADTAAPPAEPSPDTATAVKEDAAVVVNADTAPAANEDAAVVQIPKLRGGGFCAIAPSHSATPTGFLALALAGLALLRRRRR